jgi:hypothetical protein
LEEVGRHEGVGVFDGEGDFGDEPAVNLVAEGFEDLRAADDEEFAVEVTLQRERRLLVPQPDDRVARLDLGAAREDDVQAAGQRALEREPGLVAHHAGVPRGLLLKEPQVRGVVPGKLSALADGAVAVNGHDACDVGHKCFFASPSLAAGGGAAPTGWRTHLRRASPDAPDV